MAVSQIWSTDTFRNFINCESIDPVSRKNTFSFLRELKRAIIDSFKQILDSLMCPPHPVADLGAMPPVIFKV